MIFDAHAHLLPTIPAMQHLLEAMDKNGIAKAAVVGGGLVSPRTLSRNIALGLKSEVQFNNELFLAVTEQSNGRLLPFYFANPQQSVSEYHRLASRFFGLKLAPAIDGTTFADSSLDPYLAVANMHNHAVYLHCLSRAGNSVDDLVVLAKNWPAVTFILGHAGVGNLDFYAVDAIKFRQNIFFETSGGFTSVIEYAFLELGSKRLLFGTEYPLQNPLVEIAKSEALNVSDTAFADYRYANIEQLLARSRGVGGCGDDYAN